MCFLGSDFMGYLHPIAWDIWLTIGIQEHSVMYPVDLLKVGLSAVVF